MNGKEREIIETLVRYSPDKGMNPICFRVYPLEDRAFGRTLGSQDEKSEHARNGFMSALLDRKVMHSEVRKTVLEEQADGQKRPIADFICTLEDGTVVAIEVQRAKGRDDLGKRLIFSMCRICAGSLGRGMDYLKEIRKDMHERDQEIELRHAREDALSQGEKQGMARGMAQGIGIGKQQVARNMKASGMPISQIILLSGLSKEEIEKL